MRFGGIASHTTAGPTGMPPEVSIEAAELSQRDVRDAHNDPLVIDMAPSMPTRLIAPEPSTADTRSATWGLTAVQADRSRYDGSGVTVAVLDTGIERTHPAFAGISLIERDFSQDGDGDVQGHGTHVAGTVFGRDVAGQRIGVARGVTRALIGKVLGDTGTGSSEMLFDGMEWAAREGAQVISMSLGFDYPGLVKRLIERENLPADFATSVALDDYRRNIRMFDTLMATIAARAAFTGGALVCAASGNASRRQEHPNYEISVSVPAAALGVVSVGALAQGATGLEVADFSNTEPTVAAPGQNVLSAALGGGLVAWNGTSMACPHVAGVAALWWQAIPSLGLPRDAQTVTNRLLGSTRTNVFAPGVDIEDRGQGLVTAPA